MKYTIAIPGGRWVEFDKLEEAVAWLKANGRGDFLAIFGPNYSGPGSTNNGLTPEETEALEEMS